ncbi:potassium channel family protein [Lysobacter rhizosphaerae]
MILIISVGLAVMIACLAVQIASVLGVVHYYAKVARKPMGDRPLLSVFRQLASIMSMLLVSSLIQMASWAALYLWLNQFGDFQTAIYFSGVTFTSLGYGDLTLVGRVRILSAMEAADGLMMFGVTSAIFMLVLQHSITRWHGTRVGSEKE